MKMYTDKFQRRPQGGTPQQPQGSSSTVSQPGAVLRPKPVASSEPTRDEIARRAYEIYLESGCQEGRDEQNWKQAEQELRGQAKAR